MEKENFYKFFQGLFGYNDKQMEEIRTSPEKEYLRKTMKGFSINPNRKVIAEVTKAENCAAGHKVGDRYVIGADGMLLKDKCPKNICIGAVTTLNPILAIVFDRIADQREDLNPQAANHVSCSDCGFSDGGFGRVMMKIRVE